MAIAQDELHAQAEALQDYLYNASDDGRGPELIVCDDRQQAIRLHNELRVLIHLNEQAQIAASRHGEQVCIWLTDAGLKHMAAVHPKEPMLANEEVLFWQPELYS